MRVRGEFLAGEGLVATWFDQLAQNGASSFEIVLKAQHGRGDNAGFRASDTDHANPPPTRRGGDSNDRVVEIHSEIVAGCNRLLLRVG